MILGLYSFLLISVEKLLRDGLGSRSNTVNPKNENKKAARYWAVSFSLNGLKRGRSSFRSIGFFLLCLKNS